MTTTEVGLTVRLIERRVAADGVLALTLAAADGADLPAWEPGAHLDLLLPDGLVRQYSLCGDPADRSRYRVGVLRELHSRGGSRWIHDAMPAEAALRIVGPRNQFALTPAPRYEFVAGGIGITPILPMIAAAERAGADWRLLYGGRTRASMAFADELAGYGDRVTFWPQETHGLLPIRDRLAEPRGDTLIYACGPGPMLAAVEDAAALWPVRALRTERFVPREPPPPVRCTPFEVELARSGRRVTVGTDTSILEALGAIGVTVLSSCRLGTCGTCETRVLGGVPDHRDSILTEADRESADRMYICVSRACSDRLVLDR